MKTIAVILVLCIGAIYAATECEKELAANQGLIGAFVPACDEEGSYKDLQCHGSTGFCYCARKDGTKINEPLRGVYKSCKCIRHLDDVQSKLKPGIVGAFIPRCQTDGTYEKKQCWGSTGTCWCVNELTGEKLGAPSRDEVNC